MTVSWSTKIIIFRTKNEKGKDITSRIEVLSISTTLTGHLIEGGLYFTYAMLDKSFKSDVWDSFFCGTKWNSHQRYDTSRRGKPILGSYYGPLDFSLSNHPIEQDDLMKNFLRESENPWRPDYDVRAGL